MSVPFRKSKRSTNMKLLILAALIGFCAADKIVGGQAASADQFPFIVHMDSNNVEAYCDGSIINNLWILSAAHCKQTGKDSSYRVVAGDLILNDANNEQTIAMADQISHPDYDSRTLANDIMLIKLSATLQMINGASQITFPSESPPAGTECDISGWGNTEVVGAEWPNHLQYVTQPVIDKTTCNRPTSYNGEILDMMICVGTMKGGQDSCQGDSGGPVTLAGTHVQVGIVSWGYGCAEPLYPGVYTDVYYFVANGWIDNTMAAN